MLVNIQKTDSCPGGWYNGLQLCEHINGTYPVSLYRNTFPTYKANLSGACVGKSLTFNGLPQRCKMPEEKPSCRALQTLPQKCNFRCNTRHNCDPNKLKRFK